VHIISWSSSEVTKLKASVEARKGAPLASCGPSDSLWKELSASWPGEGFPSRRAEAIYQKHLKLRKENAGGGNLLTLVPWEALEVAALKAAVEAKKGGPLASCGPSDELWPELSAKWPSQGYPARKPEAIYQKHLKLRKDEAAAGGASFSSMKLGGWTKLEDEALCDFVREKTGEPLAKFCSLRAFKDLENDWARRGAEKGFSSVRTASGMVNRHFKLRNPEGNVKGNPPKRKKSKKDIAAAEDADDDDIDYVPPMPPAKKLAVEPSDATFNVAKQNDPRVVLPTQVMVPGKGVWMRTVDDEKEEEKEVADRVTLNLDGEEMREPAKVEEETGGVKVAVAVEGGTLL